MTAPTHLIMVLNRDTHELKLVSAHGDEEAEAAFQNLSSLFATTPNDVHKVTIPTACGFALSAIKSSHGAAPAPAPMPVSTRVARLPDAQASISGKASKNGVHRNAQGEYVQRLPDGSEIISDGDFSD